MMIVQYEKCGTCRKALKWMTENGIQADIRSIKDESPTESELREWIGKSGKQVRNFFNTSGKLYRELDLKNKLKTMTEEDMIALLATDGMLVKRPICIDGDTVLVGFRQEEWEAGLLK